MKRFLLFGLICSILISVSALAEELDIAIDELIESQEVEEIEEKEECINIEQKCDEIPKQVLVFSTAKPNMYLGEIVILTSQLIGFSEDVQVHYQWQFIRRDGTIVDIQGANESTYTFYASLETLNGTYRLVVTYKETIAEE